ncbi:MULTISPECIES: hypothetical protein [unclassified Mycoplasma]|uniref:hypothetical protein n=1 Tax=unclassified Mycoplasma TaxID=2683645 RepID=UPI00211C8309|nr:MULTISPECIES: hypothetical protein [unclassified Mycoplasma]UUM20048.1 hypothetical protein NPA11_01310 [Mycoplasma sp. 1578d]UUM25028.1 hypothetical protein NPA12_01285 [Mycoplasma sp. 3686d]
MSKFLIAIKSKINSDTKKLKWVLLLDKLFSGLILLLNLSFLGLAITALVIISLQSKTQKITDTTSFYILISLVVFIIASFILTLVIAIYKVNGHFKRYKKVKQTAIDLSVKYKYKVITKEEFINYLQALTQKLNKKEKIIVKNIVTKQLTGAK